jgi:adenosine deaminase
MGLTVCPVSNRFVVQSLTSNEIRSMLEFGIKATINSDDPAYFRAYLNDNFTALAEEGNFSRGEIATLARNAFEISWLDESVKSKMIETLDNYLASA